MSGARSVHSIGQRLAVACLGETAALYVRLLGATVRQVEVGSPRAEVEPTCPAPWIGAFWHDRMLFPALAFRGGRFAAMISGHRDGAILSRCLDRLGTRTVRGATLRGGGGALLVAHDLLRQGISVGVTPDGPLGPRHRVQPGVIALATSAGAPIVPLSYAAGRGFRFGSWDRFLAPWPGTRLYTAIGRPMWLPAALDAAGRERARADLEAELVRITEAVDAAAGAGDQSRANTRQAH